MVMGRRHRKKTRFQDTAFILLTAWQNAPTQPTTLVQGHAQTVQYVRHIPRQRKQHHPNMAQRHIQQNNSHRRMHKCLHHAYGPRSHTLPPTRQTMSTPSSQPSYQNRTTRRKHHQGPTYPTHIASQIQPHSLQTPSPNGPPRTTP